MQHLADPYFSGPSGRTVPCPKLAEFYFLGVANVCMADGNLTDDSQLKICTRMSKSGHQFLHQRSRKEKTQNNLEAYNSSAFFHHSTRILS